MCEVTLALDAGGTFLKCGLFSGASPVDGSLDSQPVNSNGSFSEVCAAYEALLTRQRRFAEARGLIIREVSVDTPGPFDYKNGISRMTHKYRAILDRPLSPVISAPLGGNVPVRFMHDSAAFIQGAAATLPQAGDYSRFAGVMIGTGLGFAMMTDGVVLRNANGGPLRSVYAQPYRGGIAEDVVSGRGIISAYNARADIPESSGKVIGDSAEAGDPLCRAVYCDMASSLAEIVAPLLDEYGIEVLLLGGQISKSFSVFGDTLRSALSGVRSLRLVDRAPDIDMAHLIGAAVGR